MFSMGKCNIMQDIYSIYIFTQHIQLSSQRLFIVLQSGFLLTSNLSSGNTVRCFILDKRQLLYHITHYYRYQQKSQTTECNPDSVSLCPWYLMTFLSVQEDRRNPSERAFGNICLFSVF